MDQKDHKELIRSNYTKLIDSLRGNIENVCNFLYEKNIITISVKENILSFDTDGRKTTEFLSIIEGRGNRTFTAFYEACKKIGLVKAADILQPDKCPHVSSATGSEKEENHLPDAWPTDEHIERVKNNKLQVKKVKVTKLLNPEMFNTKNIYPMFHQCRGNALIINIENFTDPNLNRRDGSQLDVQGLEQLFKGLGFHVKNEVKQWSEDEINQVIKEETEANHLDHDCFVLFFMSHGSKGGVLDTNGIFISMKSIIDRFIKVDNLKNKPKLFFFQACQADHNCKSPEDIKNGAGAAPSNPEDENEIELNRSNEDLLESLADDGADVFVFKSSPDGVPSTRSSKSGSWFTQAVIYVFSEFAYKCEFHDLCTKVNYLVSKVVSIRGKEKNIGVLHSTPGKSFYFYPSLSKN